MNKDEMHAAWIYYHEHGDIETRNKLAMQYMGTIRSAAIKVRAMRNYSVDIGYLMCFGTPLLLEMLEVCRSKKVCLSRLSLFRKCQYEMLTKPVDGVTRWRIRKSYSSGVKCKMESLSSELQRRCTQDELSEATRLTIRTLCMLNQIGISKVNRFGVPAVVSNRAEKGDSPEIAFQRKEVWDLVGRSLKGRRRQVVLLVYRDGFTNDEIANITGLSVSSVRAESSRAICQLRELFKDRKDEFIIG